MNLYWMNPWNKELQNIWECSSSSLLPILPAVWRDSWIQHQFDSHPNNSARKKNDTQRGTVLVRNKFFTFTFLMPGEILENRFGDTNVQVMEYSGFSVRNFIQNQRLEVSALSFSTMSFSRSSGHVTLLHWHVSPTHHFGKISFDFIVQFPKRRQKKFGTINAQSLYTHAGGLT